MSNGRNPGRGLGGSRVGTSVGVETVKRPRRADGCDGRSQPTKAWHQGFGVITVDGVDYVPFIHQSTCRRVAYGSSKAKFDVEIVQIHSDLWAFKKVTK